MAQLLGRLDQLDEARVAALLKQYALLPRAVRFGAVHGGCLPAESLHALGRL